MTRTFLVALDTSERAPQVLAAAVTLARQAGARLHLFRTVGIPLELPLEAHATPARSVSELLHDEAERGLALLARAVPSALLGGTHVAVGTPWQAICDAATEQGADLVIVGSHGFGGLDRLLGTTAAKVVNHCPVSVLVVREPQRLTR
jgi:nucleotide-binding universal stress UspA family protein